MTVSRRRYSRLPGTRGTVLLLVGLLCPCLSGFAIDVVAIDGKAYSEVDLTGYTKAETQEAFLAELAKLSDQDMQILVNDAYLLQPPARDAVANPPVNGAATRDERRREASLKVFALEYDRQIRSTVDFLVLGRTLDRLIETHGVVLTEYLDMELLMHIVTKYLGFCEYVVQHSRDDDAGADAAYEKVRGVYGFSLKREHFRRVLKDERRLRLPSARWPVQWGLGSDVLRTARAKAAALSFLVQRSCVAGGTYWHTAEAAYPGIVVGVPTLRVLGYTGTASALDDLLAASKASRGGGRARAPTVERFRALCATAGVPLDVRHERTTPMDFQRLALSRGLPSFGVFLNMADGSFQAFLPDDLDAAGAVPGPARDAFLTDGAMKTAAVAYLPTIIAVGPCYRLDTDHGIGTFSAIRNPDHAVAPGVLVTDKPFLKPYPDAPFREYAEGRAWSQTWFARLAASVFRADAAQQNALLDELVA